MPDQAMCSKMINSGSFIDPRRHCSRHGTVFEGGKWWCRQHAPSLVEQRREEMRHKYEMRRKQEQLWRLRLAFDKVVDHLESLDPDLAAKVESNKP